jgi:hypothetical protein
MGRRNRPPWSPLDYYVLGVLLILITLLGIATHGQGLI